MPKTKKKRTPMPTGRPPKFRTPEALHKKIEEYLQLCKAGAKSPRLSKQGKKITPVLPLTPTITGLALFLGFKDPQSLIDYTDRKKDSEEETEDGLSFAWIVTRAKAQCGDILNQQALRGEVDPRTAGLNLQANHGMHTKQVVKTTDDTTDNVTPEELADLKALAKDAAKRRMKKGGAIKANKGG